MMIVYREMLADLHNFQEVIYMKSVSSEIDDLKRLTLA